MQQQILFCYPFFRIGQWEFTPSCIFVLFFLIAFPIAHLNIWQKSNQKDCFSDFTYLDRYWVRKNTIPESKNLSQQTTLF